MPTARLTAPLRSTRPAFLLLTPVCVFLGASAAIIDGARLDGPAPGLAMLGALLAHVAVNALNEYHDFRSGLDFATRRTAFSGGSGLLPAHPELARTVLALGVLCLAGTLTIGAWLTTRIGAGILPFGIVGLALVVFYTGWINRHPLPCLVAPGTGFGLLMVPGSYYVLRQTIDAEVWVLALITFLLINDLLLLNQYPDTEADRQAGRRHFPIAHGIRASNLVFALFSILAGMLIVGAVCADLLPGASLVALLPLSLAAYAWTGAARYGASIGIHPRYLAANVAATLLTPLTLGMTLLWEAGG